LILTKEIAIMNTDLIGSVELTASAAIVIAALATGFGLTAATRVRIALALSAWFVLVVILAATHSLHYGNGLGSPGLGLAVVTPIVVLCLAAARNKNLWGGLHRVPLWLLVGVHVVRLLGVSFLILYAAGRLPASFAPVAGWGDILIGATAIPVAWLAHQGAINARTVVLLWNVLGLADPIAAVSLGVASSPGPLRLIFAEPGSAIMGTLPPLLIPGFLVPFLTAVHLGIFIRLRSGEEPMRAPNLVT
jgi:hypothetical protein